MPEGLAEGSPAEEQGNPHTDVPEVPSTSATSGGGNESALRQEGGQVPTTTAAMDGNHSGGRQPQGTAAGGARAVEFLTPRSAMTTLSSTQNNWMAGLEMPRWVSRLGSYLAPARAELAPSPLPGSTNTSPSQPGGAAFRLRSPVRPLRPLAPPTPPSSDISAEAIQAEVQRQLGGLLHRLQAAETRNDALMTELTEARQSLEDARLVAQGEGRFGYNVGATRENAATYRTRRP